MTVESDEWLAKQARGGDTKAFEEILTRYRVRVFRLCYRMAGNRADADDWTQECFIRVWTQLKAFDSDRRFEPWLLKVSANTCINLAKSRTVRQDRTSPVSIEEHVIAAPNEQLPLNQTISNENREAIHSALAHVSPVLRQAVALWATENLTFQELADTLGVPLSTAAQRVRRALIQVRGQLSKKGFEVKP